MGANILMMSLTKMATNDGDPHFLAKIPEKKHGGLRLDEVTIYDDNTATWFLSAYGELSAKMSALSHLGVSQEGFTNLRLNVVSSSTGLNKYLNYISKDLMG